MVEDTQPVFTFAYGSNMASSRLGKRCPHSDLSRFDVAKLPGYTLTFDKVSKDGSGKATIVHDPSENDEVWGVVFMIHQNDKKALDRAEGLGSGYHVEAFQVVKNDDFKMAAKAYVADPSQRNSGLRPYDWYKECVVIGAMEHGLPDTYIAKLRAVSSVVDRNEKRRQENRCYKMGRNSASQTARVDEENTTVNDGFVP